MASATTIALCAAPPFASDSSSSPSPRPPVSSSSSSSSSSLNFHSTRPSAPRLISVRTCGFSPAARVRGLLLLHPFPSRRRRLLISTASGEGEVEGHNTRTTDASVDNEGSSEPKTNEESQTTEKFPGVLRDTTEQLKEQAEKARTVILETAKETAAVIAATAHETAEKSKGNFSYIAENAPEPFKEVAETALKAHSADTPKRFAKIHDFCLGIPYGALLVTSGLLWFIISGSTAAIRFGVILGGILLALSISSLKTWKEGNSSSSYIKGQAVISLIIAVREIRRFYQFKALPTAFVALISTGMLGFYCYVYLAGGNPPKKAKAAA